MIKPSSIRKRVGLPPFCKTAANRLVLLAYDNLFDQTTITQAAGSANFTHDYNGYVTNKNRLNSNGAHDKILTNNPVYLTGPLGSHYYSTNDGMLSLLINAGSRSATAASLAHYTTLTNQVQEGTASTNTIDIGFHYAPVRGVAEIPKSTIEISSSSDVLGLDKAFTTDGLRNTFWATAFGPPDCSNSVSGWLRADLGESKDVAQIAYEVDPSSSDRIGAVWHYEIYVTDDTVIGTNSALAKGNWGWSTNAEIKIVRFPATSGRFVFLNCVKGANNPGTSGDFFKVNELWFYETSIGSIHYVPIDSDADNTDDYLSDWSPAISITRPAKVDVPDSAGGSQGFDLNSDCCSGMGCDTNGVARRQSASVTGGIAGVDYTFEAILESRVEQFNYGFDIVSLVTQDFCRDPAGPDENQAERKLYFTQGNGCGLGCTRMLVRSITNTFTVRAARPLSLEFNPVDSNWHLGAYATNTTINLKGAVQADLP